LDLGLDFGYMTFNAWKGRPNIYYGVWMASLKVEFELQEKSGLFIFKKGSSIIRKYLLFFFGRIFSFIAL
jgi:hypothetical protein